MKAAEARQLVEAAYAKADQAKYANPVKSSLTYSLLGSGLGAGLSLLGSEFVGSGGDADPELAKLKNRRRRVQAILGGAAVGGIGGLGVSLVDAIGGNQTPKTDRYGGLRKGLFYGGAALTGGSTLFHPLLKGTRVARDFVVPPAPNDVQNLPLFQTKKRYLPEGWEHSKKMNRIRAAGAGLGLAVMGGSYLLPREKESCAGLSALRRNSPKTAGSWSDLIKAHAGTWAKNNPDKVVSAAKSVGTGVGRAYSALTYGRGQQARVAGQIPDAAYAAAGY